MATTADSYLMDVLPELLSRAREARAEARQKPIGEASFEAGRATAYYEVLAYLVGELDAFGIDRASVRIDAGLDVERDLL